MAKKTLVVVHGMGQHTKKSVTTEVNKALNQAMGLYPSIDKKATAVVKIVSAEYGSFFDAYREAVSTDAGVLAEQIKKVDASNAFVGNSAAQVNRLGARFGKDDFFATHILDVILYRYTILAERIRIHVAEQIATAIKKHGSANVQVLGHSLGTAVVHDTLQKLYGPENLVSTKGGDLNLSSAVNRLGGIHMVANVSKVLQSFINVDASIVKPGELGCASFFYEYRHKLDPFTYVSPFEPTNNNRWVNQKTFKNFYRLIHDDLTEVTAANVHSLSHYIANPAVHLILFQELFGFSPKKDERLAAEDAYMLTTIQDKALAVEQAYGNLSIDSDGTVQALLQSVKEFKGLVVGFKEKF